MPAGSMNRLGHSRTSKSVEAASSELETSRLAHPISYRSPAADTARTEDLQLVARLRSRDEQAFAALVNQHHAQLQRLARMYVPSQAVAEEVVQETWMGVLQGIDRFEGRSSLKTWIFHILVNRARTRGEREGRTIPFSALAERQADSAEPAVDPSRFLEAGHPQWPGHWSAPPREWSETPEERLLSKECRGCIERAIAALPPGQREVITMRDIYGWTSEEVRNVLKVSETNQRVLLHRARSKVRAALEEYYNRA